MKKSFTFFLAAVMCVMFASASYAAGMEKLKSGASELVKSPLQLKDSIVNEYNASKFKPFGVVGGGLKGLFYTGKEAVKGLVDIVTFPVDLK